MSQPLFFRKHLGSFRPAEECLVAEEALSKIKLYDVVELEIRRRRNIRHMRLFWALMNKVHVNLSEDRALLYPKPENLVDTIKLMTGCREDIVMPDGEIRQKPGSIAFHKMPQNEFDVFFANCADLLIKHWLPGVTDEELKNEVLEMVR